VRNNLFTLDDHAIRQICKPRRHWRWNYRKCWPVRFIRNFFGFTAVEEMKVQLLAILKYQEELQKQIDDLLERMKAAEE